MDFKPLASFIDRITSWRVPWAEVLVMHRNDTVFHYRNGYANLKRKHLSVMERSSIYIP